MDVDAISDAVRGVLTGTVGTVRTVASGKFTEKIHGNAADPEVWIRARQGSSGALQAMADVRIGAARRTGWIGPANANKNIWVLPVDVLLYYAALPYADLVPGRRYDIRAQAAEDTVTVTLALTWPGNLTEDVSSNATGIVPGGFVARGEPAIERELFTDSIGLYVLRVPFDAWVQETQAVA
jgi:hypothetical protein